MEILTGNNIQNFGLSKKEPRIIYTLENKKGSESSSVYINSNNERDLLFSSHEIGHQGFSIYEEEQKEVYVLTSARNDAYHALYFHLNDGKLKSRKFIKFFDSGFYPVNETMPTISSNQKYLIVRGRLSPRRMIFRIYDFDTVKKIIKDSGDYVDLNSVYKYQWEMPVENLTDVEGELRPLQAISSDGDLIYLLFGNSKINDKAIFVYSFSGALINYNTKVDIGKNRALSDGDGHFYEPEGLALSPTGKSLLILFVTGNGGKHFNRIFTIDKSTLQ
ncbi:Uncharacterised protein [Yersinia intermedia]|jgi:hypothetical protein|uniref:phage baseplate protein n=2 Tax=Yersinia intermedia TaxID=631 RepID=UPI0005DD8460|nr:hypothetical protein [Yersinia intermedia]UZM72136.1 hypothetical protein OP861_05630 [Yersinia intermedia]CNC50415.1 Uncharacterised protein [Yersinia intermedia]CNG92153.1 Uncharacterised protein [Yersinia intermedia]